MGGHFSLRDLVRMMYEGPFVSIDRSICNPYDSCELENGRLKWVWVSNRKLSSAGLSLFEGIIVDRIRLEVYRAVIVRVEGFNDRVMRIYKGPLILKEVPLSLRDGIEGSKRRCRCGEVLSDEKEWLIKHLMRKHYGDTRPTALEVEAFVYALLLKRV